MKDDLINKLTTQANDIRFAEDAPAEIDGFALKKIFAANEDKFIFFAYTDEKIHCAITTYFHTETNEFKVRQRIGLTEFCLTNFFTEDFAHFKELLDARLPDVIKNLRGFQRGKHNRFLDEKKIYTWQFGLELPATLEGFELFIKPAAPVEVTNGSFVVINYADFTLNSDFVIYFNMYTDEFSGEARINGAPHVTYAFDAKTLPQLEEKLKKNLTDELREIRRLSKCDS
ncbi:MAG: hypothetical protein IJS69_00850 [Selenomonadaceae bacterium]|nr:hypothetical protein [Selenomonadaceae bacterium]